MIKNVCMRDNQITNMFGRVRHLVGGGRRSNTGRAVLRQAVNFPIQSGASDLMLYGIMPPLMTTMIQSNMKSLMIGNIHDSIIFDVFREEEDTLRSMLREALGDPLLPHTSACEATRWNEISTVPITYDVELMGVYAQEKRS